MIPTVCLNKIFPQELELETIQLKRFLGQFGNISVESVCKIALIVKYFKPRKIFEIGTFNGLTTLQMAINSPADTSIYTLDLPEDIQPEWTAGLDVQNRRVGEYFVNTPFKNKIIQLFHDSTNFDFSPYTNQIDIVFIDAAHDYTHKQIDTIHGLQMLSSNGILIWDNYNDVICPDVTRYLDQLSTDLPIVHLKNTHLAVYWKKE